MGTACTAYAARNPSQYDSVRQINASKQAIWPGDLASKEDERQLREAGYARRDADGNVVRTRQGMFLLRAYRYLYGDDPHNRRQPSAHAVLAAQTED